MARGAQVLERVLSFLHVLVLDLSQFKLKSLILTFKLLKEANVLIFRHRYQWPFILDLRKDGYRLFSTPHLLFFDRRWSLLHVVSIIVCWLSRSMRAALDKAINAATRIIIC